MTSYIFFQHLINSYMYKNLETVGCNLPKMNKSRNFLSLAWVNTFYFKQRFQRHKNDNKITKQGVQELQAFAFCVVKVNDEHTKPRFRFNRKLRG